MGMTPQGSGRTDVPKAPQRPGDPREWPLPRVIDENPEATSPSPPKDFSISSRRTYRMRRRPGVFAEKPRQPRKPLDTTQKLLVACVALLALLIALGGTAWYRAEQRTAAKARLDTSKSEFAACMAQELQLASIRGAYGPLAEITASVKCHPGDAKAAQNRRDLETLGGAT